MDDPRRIVKLSCGHRAVSTTPLGDTTRCSWCYGAPAVVIYDTRSDQRYEGTVYHALIAAHAVPEVEAHRPRRLWAGTDHRAMEAEVERLLGFYDSIEVQRPQQAPLTNAWGYPQPPVCADCNGVGATPTITGDLGPCPTCGQPDDEEPDDPSLMAEQHAEYERLTY